KPPSKNYLVSQTYHPFPGTPPTTTSLSSPLQPLHNPSWRRPTRMVSVVSGCSLVLNPLLRSSMPARMGSRSLLVDLAFLRTESLPRSC
ncbi:hypothetical protein BGZ95_006610, partial [Linnemannia exigua]